MVTQVTSYNAAGQVQQVMCKSRTCLAKNLLSELSVTLALVQLSAAVQMSAVVSEHNTEE